MFEQKIILSQIFRNFEVESLQNMEDMKCMPDIVLRPKLGVQMKMKKRISAAAAERLASNGDCCACAAPSSALYLPVDRYRMCARRCSSSSPSLDLETSVYVN
ncbi:hypothetical protein V9T40_000500 [Parthenolecanium corni]|uniref:Uncharacterized protein n=1 Tax=Parthenolecanium corni TaxID=536013 RepID=A0AAN9TQJ6_9HEMI